MGPADKAILILAAATTVHQLALVAVDHHNCNRAPDTIVVGILLAANSQLVTNMISTKALERTSIRLNRGGIPESGLI
jgi:hypothetical protein